MPFLLQGVMLRNTTSKESLAHLHNVMILLLKSGFNYQWAKNEGGRKFVSMALSLSITASSPFTDFFLRGGQKGGEVVVYTL